MATLAAFAEDSNAKIRKPLASFDRDGADIFVRRVFVDRDADRAGKRLLHILTPLHGAHAAAREIIFPADVEMCIRDSLCRQLAEAGRLL